MIVEELVAVLGLQIRDTGLTTFKANLQGVIGKIGLVTAGAAAMAAGLVAAMGAAAARQAESTKATAVLARNLGMSAEELFKFEFAAKQAGIPANAFAGKLADISTKLQGLKLGHAIELQEAFGLLGLPAIREGDKAIDVFLRLADAVRNAADQETALAIAHKGLGVGLEFDPFLTLGSAGILGLKNSAPAPDNKTIRELEHFANSMLKLQTSLSVFQARVGSPLVEGAADFFDSLTNGRNKEAFDSFTDKIKEMNEALVRAIAGLRVLFSDITKGLPEDSWVYKVLGLAALARFVSPTGAAVVATGYAYDAYRTDPGKVDSILEKLGEWADKAGSILDMIPGNSVAIPAVPLNADPETQAMWARQVMNNAAATFHVDKFIVNVDRPEDVRPAAEGFMREKVGEAADRATRNVDR